MEYAKGRTSSALRGKAKVRAERERCGRQLREAGVRNSGQPLWRTVGGRQAWPGPRAPRARAR